MYVTTANACNEPNAETPISASAIAAQDARVAAVQDQFLNGNAAVYDLVQALGGNLPGLVPGSPAVTPAAPAAPTPNPAVTTVGGASSIPASTAQIYAAPGVLAAPLFIPPGPFGGPKTPGGVDLGPAVKSMVLGCDVPWAGPTLGANPASSGGSAGNSGLIWWGLAGLAAVLWWLGSEGALQ